MAYIADHEPVIFSAGEASKVDENGRFGALASAGRHEEIELSGQAPERGRLREYLIRKDRGPGNKITKNLELVFRQFTSKNLV